MSIILIARRRDVRYEAFGSTHPTRESVFSTQGSFATRIFSKGTQRRVDKARALRQELHVPLVEQHGPAILSQPQLERARVASKHERRGASQAASIAAATGRGSTPKRGPPSPPRIQRLTLRSRPRTLQQHLGADRERPRNAFAQRRARQHRLFILPQLKNLQRAG